MVCQIHSHLCEGSSNSLPTLEGSPPRTPKNEAPTQTRLTFRAQCVSLSPLPSRARPGPTAVQPEVRSRQLCRQVVRIRQAIKDPRLDDVDDLLERLDKARRARPQG